VWVRTQPNLHTTRRPDRTGGSCTLLSDYGCSIGVPVQEMTIEEEQEWQPAAWLPSADEVAGTSLAEELARVGQCVCPRCLPHADASNHS